MILVMLIPLVSIFWLQLVSPADGHAMRANVGCGFHLSCSGAFNGSIGEKSSGQARASSGVSPSLFTWFGDTFADGQGNGCWWTPPTYTLQCDKNQPPDHGFQIGCDGTLSFGGQSVFYECPTGVGDEVNIYLKPPNNDQCHEITIYADSCAPSTCPGGGVSPGPGATNSPPASGATTPSTVASSSTTTSPSSASQGPPTPSPFTTGGEGTSTTSITSTSTVTTTQPVLTTTGCVEVGPDSIILVDQGNPDTAYGPNNAGRIQISPNASTIFIFAFSDADLSKTCELTFRIPRGRLFNLTGTGIITLEALDNWANANTTYNNMPHTIEPYGNGLLYEGVEIHYGPFPCPGATTRSAVLLTEGPMADTCLDCNQGDGMGMFLTKC
ncbi:ubiquitin 3 binding protein But2 C-terminal domain-containing protein [Nemania sp. FL0031]|nr:ubiquitin 3 binding protein But2 C-terminal domain-containing protein [Nemania sp. FL0031]